MNDILCIGIGNEGRGDDKAGIIFTRRLEEVYADRLDFEFVFQLAPEHALQISKYQYVFFADATLDVFEEGFCLTKINLPEKNDVPFTSHVQTPENIVLLSKLLYNAMPDCYLIGISGKTWELYDRPSAELAQHIKAAFQYFKSWLDKKFPDRFLPASHNETFKKE